MHSQDVRIEVRAESKLTAAEARLIYAWLIEEFAPEVDGLVWSDVDWHILVWMAEELVSHVEIVERVGRVGGCPVALGGVGGVVTREAWRRRGLGRMALERAWAFMCADLDVEFGLLICDEGMIPFYQKLGWEVAEAPMAFDQPGGKVVSPDVTMVKSCRGEVWPPGAIDLCGPPW